MTSQTRALRGPYIILAFVLLVSAGATGAWIALHQRPVPAQIVDIVNIDGEHAVVVRGVKDQPERSWLSVFERQRGELWGGLIRRYAHAPGARTSVAVTAGVVAVRTIAHGQPTVLAFDAVRGHKLGRFEPFEERRDISPTGFALSAVGNLVHDKGQVFEFFGEDEKWAEIYAMHLGAGRVLWKKNFDGLIRRAWLRNEYIVIDREQGAGKGHSTELQVMDRHTGETVQTWQGHGSACVTDDTIYMLSRDNASVIRLAQGRPSEPAGDSLSVRSQTSWLFGGMCGHRGPNVLLPVTTDTGSLGILAFDRATRELVWQRTLEPGTGWSGWIQDEVALHAPDDSPFSGRLGRFVPMLARPSQAPPMLVMLDTDTGQVAWQSPALAWLENARLMRSDDVHILYAPARDLVVVFDAGTGALLGAMELQGFGPIWPHRIAGGQIWVFHGKDWAVLDHRTLAPHLRKDAPRAGIDVKDRLVRELTLPGHAL